MRASVFLCDNCNTDLTDDVHRFGGWQAVYTVSGGKDHDGGPMPHLRREVCSLACLVEVVQSLASQASS